MILYFSFVGCQSSQKIFFILYLKKIAYAHMCFVSLPVCDPVLGDEGKLYVPEELVTVYRERVRLLSLIKKDVSASVCV